MTDRLPLTVLRPVSFMENFNNPSTVRMIASGKWSYASDPSKQLQMIATEDIGFLGAIAMDNKDDWLGRAVEIAGDSLTPPQIAQKFAEVLAHVPSSSSSNPCRR